MARRQSEEENAARIAIPCLLYYYRLIYSRISRPETYFTILVQKKIGKQYATGTCLSLIHLFGIYDACLSSDCLC